VTGVVTPATPRDLAVVAAQLGRRPRGTRAIAHWCRCGLPDVVQTTPYLPDGTPFPTLYYLTCPRAVSAVGRLEARGVMRDMTNRLRTDPELADRYRRAYEDYVARRNELGRLPGDPGVGGMPHRVKCLHALVAHALAVGPGVNPFGDEALAMLPEWSARGPCVDIAAVEDVQSDGTVEMDGIAESDGTVQSDGTVETHGGGDGDPGRGH